MTKRRRGAQPGNRNAFKTGLHTAEMRTLRKQARLRVRKLKSAMEAARLANAALSPLCGDRGDSVPTDARNARRMGPSA
jgi:hypothetical protein